MDKPERRQTPTRVGDTLTGKAQDIVRIPEYRRTKAPYMVWAKNWCIMRIRPGTTVP